MLNPAQLANFQAQAARTLDLVANTTRNTASSSSTDGRGHPAETWTAVLTGVACGMAEPTVKDLQLYPAAFIGSERAAKFSFPFGSDVKANDRITTGGRTYRVQVPTDRDSYSLLVQVIAVQINTTVE